MSGNVVRGCRGWALWPTRSLFLVGALVLAGCGGPAESDNYVTGKVLLDGQQVAGTVTFIWDDKKIPEKVTPIDPKGEYKFSDPPAGTVKILVKGMLGGQPTIVGGPKDKDTPKMADLPGGKGVAPPAKYESAATSPLTFEVKKGKQKFDITLSQ